MTVYLENAQPPSHYVTPKSLEDRIMAFAKIQYSKQKVNRAGEIIANQSMFSPQEHAWANEVLANWRACHGYPINTFQATLRDRLKSAGLQAIVAQRLKRTPSIILKLQRFEGMKLARMQDIGGLRAVLKNVAAVRIIESTYRNKPLKHILRDSDDYITSPKEDGYRGIHLIYHYKNERVPDYDGLSLELQIRTLLQHAWATAVETMGTFLGQALKSGRGDYEWRSFFAKAGAALAVVEKTASVPGFEKKSKDEVFAEVADAEQELRVLEKLRGFAIAADKITTFRGQGAYHLVVLDSRERTVSIRPFPKSRLEQANLEYSEIEERTKSGELIEAVLVSAGPVDALRKAYPNYFLDTQGFVAEIERVIKIARKSNG
ncbi:MAG: RelA/SpoT domain-containing protein [Verrucomicrobia bacterium]|nr:RelA/SpoT domain-containing protein [Verrucomicrobiota bacterium]